MTRTAPCWAIRTAHLVSLVVAFASCGVISLALIWGFAFRNFPNVGEGSNALEFTHDGWYALLLACYLPLLLWAPLLAAVTYDFYRRRVRTR